MLPVSLISKQSGQTKLLLIGTIAIVVAITLQIYRKSQLTQARGSLSNLIDHSEIIRKTLEARLKNPETCFKTLEGLTIAPGESVSPLLNFIYDPEIDPKRTVTKKGDEVSSGIELAELRLELAPSPDMRTRIGDLSTKKYDQISFKRYPAQLHIGFRSAKGETLASPVLESAPAGGENALHHGIPLYVWVDESNRIASCFGTQSVGAICNDLGGYFMVDAKTAEERCRQSVFAEKSAGDGIWRSVGACRVAGLAESATQCEMKFGDGRRKVQALTVQDASKRLVPSGPKGSALCMLCY